MPPLVEIAMRMRFAGCCVFFTLCWWDIQAQTLESLSPEGWKLLLSLMV